MKTASVTGGPTMSLAYDAVGNITSKTLTGSSDPTADYALSMVYSPDGALLTDLQGDLAASIVYDANRNIVSRGDLSLTWTAFNKPATVTKNGQTSTFRYGPERARYRQDYSEGGESITRFYVGGLFEAVHRTNTTEYHHHIVAAGEMVATHIRRTNDTHTTHWVLKDHLGSVDVVLDENRQEVGRTSFDAFGGRRSAGWDGPPQPGTIVGGVREFTSRGYTGHEQLESVGIIHMNGRVYEPLIGRFLSPDPIVAAPGSSQGWNRFGYVMNSPLGFVDPTGYSSEDDNKKKCKEGVNCSPYPPVLKPGDERPWEGDHIVVHGRAASSAERNLKWGAQVYQWLYRNGLIGQPPKSHQRMYFRGQENWTRIGLRIGDTVEVAHIRNEYFLQGFADSLQAGLDAAQVIPANYQLHIISSLHFPVGHVSLAGSDPYGRYTRSLGMYPAERSIKVLTGTPAVGLEDKILYALAKGGSPGTSIQAISVTKMEHDDAFAAMESYIMNGQYLLFDRNCGDAVLFGLQEAGIHFSTSPVFGTPPVVNPIWFGVAIGAGAFE